MNPHITRRFPFITYPLNFNNLYIFPINPRFIVKRSNYKNKYLNQSQILLKTSLIKKHKVIFKIIKRPKLQTRITKYQKLLIDPQFYLFLCFFVFINNQRYKFTLKERLNKQTKYHSFVDSISFSISSSLKNLVYFAVITINSIFLFPDSTTSKRAFITNFTPS